MELRNKIFRAIKLSTYNKENPEDPPGYWAYWLCEHGVYSDQMQAQFCLTCGEYKWLTYQTHSYRYQPAPSEPMTCNCNRTTYYRF